MTQILDYELFLIRNLDDSVQRYFRFVVYTIQKELLRSLYDPKRIVYNSQFIRGFVKNYFRFVVYTIHQGLFQIRSFYDPFSFQSYFRFVVYTIEQDEKRISTKKNKNEEKRNQTRQNVVQKNVVQTESRIKAHWCYRRDANINDQPTGTDRDH